MSKKQNMLKQLLLLNAYLFIFFSCHNVDLWDTRLHALLLAKLASTLYLHMHVYYVHFNGKHGSLQRGGSHISNKCKVSANSLSTTLVLFSREKREFIIPQSYLCYSAMATCMTSVAGRISSVVGNILFGALLESNCEIPIGLVGGVVLRKYIK